MTISKMIQIQRKPGRLTWLTTLCLVAMIFLGGATEVSAGKGKRDSKATGKSGKGGKSGKSPKGGKTGKSLKSHKQKKSSKQGKKLGKKGKASEILDLMVDAIGGEDNLLGLVGIEMEAKGETWIMFEGREPEEIVRTSTYERIYTLDLENDRHHVSEVLTPFFETFEFFPQQEFTRVINGNVGGMEGGNIFIPPGTMPSESVAALKRQQMLFNPHLILQKALKHPDIVSAGEKSKDYYILVVENEVSDIYLYVDKNNGLISTLWTVESNPLIRDTEIKIEYSNWNIDADGLLFPYQVQMYGINGLLWDETRPFVEINMVSLIDDDIFDLPDGTDPDSFDAGRYEFGLQSHHNQEGFFEIGFQFPYNDGIAPPLELATDFYLLASTSNSVAIRYRHGVIVLEAPGSDTHGKELVGVVQDLFPQEHIRTIVESHHHADHASGVREVVAAGADLLIGHGVKHFWEETLEADSYVRPDSLSESHRGYFHVEEVPKLGHVVLADEPNLKVTAYHTDRDPHAMDNVFTTIETDGIIYVYEADMYNARLGLTVVVGGPQGFFEALRDVGVVDDDCTSDIPLIIIPAHGIVTSLEEALTELDGCPLS